MFDSLKVGLLIERSNQRNFAILIAVLIIVFGFIFYIKAQSVGNQIFEKKGDYNSTQAILSQFPVKDASETGDGSELFKNLTEQKRSIALQIASLTMDKQNLYYEASLHLAELRQKAFNIEGYEDISELLPSKIQNSLDYLYFEKMKEVGKDTIPNLLQYIPFLLFFFSNVGPGWYIFVSFHTSSILIDDFEHTSLIQGFPVRFDYYILSKCIISFLPIIASIPLIFICATPLWILNGFGDLSTCRHLFRKRSINFRTSIYRNEYRLYDFDFNFYYAAVHYLKRLIKKFIFNTICPFYFILFTDNFPSTY
ncbi:MAG: hypothetical protein ABS939_12055 [Psychrobacillus sp.]